MLQWLSKPNHWYLRRRSHCRCDNHCQVCQSCQRRLCLSHRRCGRHCQRRRGRFAETRASFYRHTDTWSIIYLNSNILRSKGLQREENAWKTFFLYCCFWCCCCCCFCCCIVYDAHKAFHFFALFAFLQPLRNRSISRRCTLILDDSLRNCSSRPNCPDGRTVISVL